MALTPKQEAFAHAVASGSTQADAYRIAFDVGEKTKPETVQANASRLMADSRVSARVKELRGQLAEMALWTRLDSVQTLADIAKGVDEDAKASDRVNAVKALNAMQGWDAPNKVQVSGDPDNPVVSVTLGKEEYKAARAEMLAKDDV